MKKFLLLTTVLILATTQVSARVFKAVVRTESNKAVEKDVELKNLISDDSFDGEFFKVVVGKSDEAIKFNDKEELVFRAATAYYHLTLSREYFVNKLKSQRAIDIGKMVIRIDHTNQFSELGHFAHDNLDPQFNNALTVPAGKGLVSRGIKPWNTEIWFRPKKKVHIDDLNVNNLGHQNMKMVLKSFRNQIHMQSLQRFLMMIIQVSSSDSQAPFPVDQLVRTAGSSVIMEFGYQFIDPISKLTARKWYWLDTALVPEIIYHEYAHAALSDHLELSHNSAVVEGMADFFAGQISGSPKLAKHIKKHNTFNGKNAKRKQDYMIQFEMGQYANTDFVFGLLWSMKKVLGEEKAEDFVYGLRENIDANSGIRTGLVDGLIKTCDEVCESPFTDRLKILKNLNNKGL